MVGAERDKQDLGAQQVAVGLLVRLCDDGAQQFGRGGLKTGGEKPVAKLAVAGLEHSFVEQRGGGLHPCVERQAQADGIVEHAGGIDAYRLRRQALPQTFAHVVGKTGACAHDNRPRGEPDGGGGKCYGGNQLHGPEVLVRKPGTRWFKGEKSEKDK